MNHSAKTETTLSIETLVLPAAELGQCSPMPPLKPLVTFTADLKVDPAVPEEDKKYLGYGIEAHALPYQMQNGYDRNLKDKAFKLIVLENEFLRAEFLPELGGRLWSLLHKPSNRQLLHVNPVFQPANLAVRNAWFSGGVEWNVSILGHSPFTCSAVYAASLFAEDGTPVLRMYEYERVRGVPYQIDCFLPADSPVLFVRVRIINPHDHGIPMYWWSNIAVDQTSQTRVIVPSNQAINFGVKNEMKILSIPISNGIDISYPIRIKQSEDYFYKLDKDSRPFITAVEADGKGLFQVSNNMLKSRKLFVWGDANGGNNWQDFLARPGCRYLELQAGLAQTQSECVPMPAYADWQWIEAYGLIETDSCLSHGSDWNASVEHVSAKIGTVIPERSLMSVFAWSASFVDTPPEEMIQCGSGWPYLESLHRNSQKTEQFGWLSMPFCYDRNDASLDKWHKLVTEGYMPSAVPTDSPGPYAVDESWRQLLEKAVTKPESDNWYAWFHLGIMRYYNKDMKGAEAAWRHSVKLEPNAWSLRNIAVLMNERGDYAECANMYIRAVSMMPQVQQLVSECCKVFIEMEMISEIENVLKLVPSSVLQNGRVQLCVAQVGFAKGDYQKAKTILSNIVVNDIREAETTITDLWFKIEDKLAESFDYKKEPLPKNIDFRSVI